MGWRSTWGVSDAATRAALFSTTTSRPSFLQCARRAGGRRSRACRPAERDDDGDGPGGEASCGLRGRMAMLCHDGSTPELSIPQIIMFLLPAALFCLTLVQSYVTRNAWHLACMARQMRFGVAGISMWRTPNCDSASTIAFATAGSAPTQPPRPPPSHRSDWSWSAPDGSRPRCRRRRWRAAARNP